MCQTYSEDLGEPAGHLVHGCPAWFVRKICRPGEGIQLAKLHSRQVVAMIEIQADGAWATLQNADPEEGTSA